MQQKLARYIIDYFPYPIASIFKVLMADECLDPGPLRLQYILKTAEATARFLGFVALLECRARLESGLCKAGPRTLSADFESRFGKPSYGTWVHFAREGLRWLHHQDSELVVPELKTLFYDESSRETPVKLAMDRLVEIRNGLSHERIQAFRPNDFEELCTTTYEYLMNLLGGLRFFDGVSLGYINTIEVSKKRNEDASFLHRIKDLTGHSDDFEGTRPQYENYRETNVVIMRYEDNQRYLNMDPLLVYDAVAGKAPDIFFFGGFSSSRKIHYIGCKHGGSFDSDECRRMDEIENETSYLIELMGGEK